jgi:hypothetical protein
VKPLGNCISQVNETRRPDANSFGVNAAKRAMTTSPTESCGAFRVTHAGTR